MSGSGQGPTGHRGAMQNRGMRGAATVGSGGLTDAGGIPQFKNLDAFAVNRMGWEAIRQSLYDSTSYVAAGQPTLTFFQIPLGQGTGFGGGVKSYSDTNMQLAGQMPANQVYLVQSIEILLEPTTPTVTAQMPAVFGAQAVAAIVNDVYIVRRSGNLNFFIGSKSYLQEAPLMRFPSKTKFDLSAALADVSSTAASLQSRIAFGDAIGRPYILSPGDIQLESSQNFNVQLGWPEGNQAITNPMRVFVILDGVLYRRSQ